MAFSLITCLLSRCWRITLSVHISGNVYSVPISAGPVLWPPSDTNRDETTNSRPPVDMWRDQINLPGGYRLLRAPSSCCEKALAQNWKLVLIRALDRTFLHAVTYISAFLYARNEGL